MSRPENIEKLAAQLRSKNGVARAQARESLVALGEEAVPALLPLLADADTRVRWEAAKALSEIGSPEGIPTLVPLLEDPEPGVRWLAAKALIAAGTDGIPELLRRLIERPESVCLRQGAHHVFRAFGKMYKALHDLLAPVLSALESPQAADILPEIARDALHTWRSMAREQPRTQEEADQQFLFDSHGDVVAFRNKDMVLDIDGRWIGWLPEKMPDVMTPNNAYLGTICPDDRFYVLPDRPGASHLPTPPYPDQPPIPDLPAPREYAELPPGARDVRLGQ